MNIFPPDYSFNDFELMTKKLQIEHRQSLIYNQQNSLKVLNSKKSSELIFEKVRKKGEKISFDGKTGFLL